MTQLDDESFQNAIFDKDDLGCVIRAHLHIEYEFALLLKELVPNMKSLDKMHLDFSAKIQLAIALGIDEVRLKPLVALSNIRNKFAHKPLYTLNKDAVNNLYKSLSSREKEIYKKSLKKVTDNNINLSQKDRFILCVIVIRRLIQHLVVVLTESNK
jgi:hypothetical protein